METVIIQISSPKIMNLLQELEELKLLKILKRNTDASAKLSRKYAGKLSADVAEELQKHIEKGREEWDSI